MTRTIDPATQAQLESPTPKPFRLFEFYLDSGTRYYTDTDRKILWNGNIYLPFPIALGEIKYSTTGMIDRVTVGTSDVTREFSGLIIAEGFRGRRFIIRRVMYDETGYGVTPPVEVFNGLMDEVEGNIGKSNSTVQITATTELAYWQMPIPKRSYQVGCEWAAKGRFKGVECRYAGAGTVCDGTWSQCKAYGNQAHYGGFRHLPLIENTPIYWGKAAPGKIPIVFTR